MARIVSGIAASDMSQLIHHGAAVHTIDKLRDPATRDWRRTVRRGSTSWRCG
ncbi:hypothetical protein [Cupriavidus lacunae]|uniref:hypothetical protein n=1 Tax=Cupriavidus lacunae TaxID=2666307 RepID=UPI001374C196|nr:hypothetical protein [Cupriavidus lacunae]